MTPTPEDVLIKQVSDALKIRNDIDAGRTVLLDAFKMQRAMDYVLKARTEKPYKDSLLRRENLKLWGLVALSMCAMAATVTISILFRGGLW